MEAADDRHIHNAVEQLDTVRRAWLRRPNVGAVDVGYRIKDGHLTDVVAIRVHLERKLPEEAVPRHDLFPREVGGVLVDVIEAVYEASGPAAGTVTTGSAELDAPDSRSRVTPLMGGISVGNPRVTAGTLGAIVWDRQDAAPHILSNWHVLAGSEPQGGCRHRGGRSGGQPHIQNLAGPEPYIQNLAGLEPYIQNLAGPEPYIQNLAGLEPYIQNLAGLEPYIQNLLGAGEYDSACSGRPHYQSAAVGEPIYQPGRFDGGTSADVVARLSRVRLDAHMDAALARVVGNRPYCPHILGVGAVTGIEEHPRLGMQVRKSGRSSGVTEGLIDGVSLSTTIEFDHGPHQFDDQLHIVPRAPWPSAPPRMEVSEGGDSGSVWITDDGLAVGLHFAGEREGGPEQEHALASPMQRVADALGFTFTPPLRSAPRPGADGGGTAGDLSALIVVGAARAALADVLRAAEGQEDGRCDGVPDATVQRCRRILDLAAQALR